MFTVTGSRISPSSYESTLKEINQQPEKWLDVFTNYELNHSKIEDFLNRIRQGSDKPVRVIFTGAGTSEYVGNTIVDYLNQFSKDFRFESIGTTSLVSNPYLYFKKNEKTLLVSFARSGNSPESLAAVGISKKLVTPLYQLAITCAEDGKLAMHLANDPNALVLIMPEGTNDKGFAMTSSFSCMMLSALLVFGSNSLIEKNAGINKIVNAANKVLERAEEIQKLLDFDFSRIIYLGSGPLYGLTNECRLKVLELTAGQVATMHESSMGFRHGPKSFINDNSFVIDLISNDNYTRQYDGDILNEVYHDGIAKKVLALSAKDIEGDFDKFILREAQDLEDIELAFPYVMFAQYLALLTSLRVGNTPDTPSKTGTVNRVVKGVTIHEL